VWDIIKEGKPVVNYETDFTGVVPRGAEWYDMEGFVTQKYGPFSWLFKNSVGGTLAEFGWYFSYSCKGSYDGHGAFLDDTGVAIKNIYAAWGFTVNVNCTASKRPVNHGTKVDPIAGTQLDVTMEVSSVLQKFVKKCRVGVRGDCKVTLISCDGY
jgi:hypothetical protein